MSDIMRAIPFGNLMDWIMEEFKTSKTIFGVSKIYKHESDKTLEIFNEKIETPFGPAAGPHTQLSQNLVAAYVGGSRFFELKTVQKLEGEELGIVKPCIYAKDEGYNTEWSTELFIPDALGEYIRAWFAIKLISREFGFGSPDGFVFNMSVGYDLEGIKTPKIDNFIEGMKEATKSPAWEECVNWVKANLHKFDNINDEYVDGISSKVCNSITLSTLHGCPPQEIERIVSYLIKEKGLHTYIKCNPTLVGYDYARKILDDMGYDYLEFDDHHFKADLQFDDSVEMINRLMELGKEQNVEFGVKLTNTFPVKISNGELSGEQMYMSGKSLYPLTIRVAEILERAFDGKLPVSYSGGADINNIAEIYDCGIFPITVCTVLLKQGGYNKLLPMAQKLAEMEYKAFDRVDVEKVAKLAADVRFDKNYIKSKAVQTAGKSTRENKCTLGVKACNNCIDVCPNRANVAVKCSEVTKLVHVDKMCNECGNCILFCPFGNIPYKDKLTVFANKEDFNNSKNNGFVFVDKKNALVRIEGKSTTIPIESESLPNDLNAITKAINNMNYVV